MAESQQQQSPDTPQPSSDQLLQALERAHLAGNSEHARELAAWHQELYSPAPEPEPPGLVERGANALRSLVTDPAERNAQPLTPEQGQAAPQIEEVPDWNMARGAGERVGDLGGGFLDVARTVGNAAEDTLGLGGFVWEEGSALPKYLGSEEYAAWREQGGEDVLEVAADKMGSLDLGYVPEHTWESVKEEFREGGALSGSAWGEVALYGAEQGIKSIPDMVAVTLNLPGYVIARSGEIGQTRAENDGREQAELTDVLAAAPFALGSAILERIGAKGITQAGAESVGKQALKRGVAYAAARTAREGGKAAGREAGTEFVQEGIIEYIGERFGTEAAMSFAEGAERGIAGAVAGGVYGGAAGTATAGTREATRASPEAEVGRAMQQEADRLQPTDDGSRAAAERLDPENAQYRAEPQAAPEPEAPQATTPQGPRKSMGELVREKLAQRGITTPQAQGYEQAPRLADPFEVELGLPTQPEVARREEPAQEPPDAEPEPTGSDGLDLVEAAKNAGRQAANAGQPREVPTEVRIASAEDAANWLRGYDEAAPQQSLPVEEEQPAESETQQRTREILGGAAPGDTVRLRELGTQQDGMTLTVDSINDDGSVNVTTSEGAKRKLSAGALETTSNRTEDGVLADVVTGEQPESVETLQEQYRRIKAERDDAAQRLLDQGRVSDARLRNRVREYDQQLMEIGAQIAERGGESATDPQPDTTRAAPPNQGREGQPAGEAPTATRGAWEGAVSQEIARLKDMRARLLDGDRDTDGRELTTREVDLRLRQVRGYLDQAPPEGWQAGDPLPGPAMQPRETTTPDEAPAWWSRMTGAQRNDALEAAGIRGNARTRWESLTDQQKQALESQWGGESPTLEEPTTEATRDEPGQLDPAGEGALEGASAEPVQDPQAAGDAGPGRASGGRADAGGGQRAGGGRVSTGRGVSDGEGAVSVPAGGERRGRGAQPGGEPVQGGTGRAPSGTQRDGGGAGSGVTTRGDRAAVTAREEAADQAPTPKGATTQTGQPASDRPAKMFTITGELGTGGPKTKFKKNLAAIQILKTLHQEGRQATLEEQQALAEYVGWGGLPQAFEGDKGKVTKGWEKEAKQLKEALTEAEYDAARRSTQDAHYTSTEIVGAMWQGLERLGFRGGRVLEPSVGTGNFLGLMPPGLRSQSQISAVELDPITGGIAEQLYPAANIQAPLGFQEFTAPDGYFQLAIGNPPFGSQTLYDGKRKHLSKFSIHNYFFAKSLDLLAPNGVLAMVVSSRLMDSGRGKARDYIAERAELLGAIRLPNNAFLKNAGTEVTTDLIFLRKLKEGEAPTGESWGDVSMVTDAKGIEVPLNEYFQRHPEMLLGEWGAYGSMYGPNEPALVAREGQDTPALLRQAIAKLPADIMDAPGQMAEIKIERSTSIEGVKVGSMYLDGGTVKLKAENELGQAYAEAVEFKSTRARERVTGMIQVRDVATDLRKAQLSEAATEEALQALRDKLNREYDRFVKAQGPLNSDANKRLMRDDPSWPQIAALEEKFDKGISTAVAKRTGETPRKPSAEKAAIFRTRTQQPYQAPDKASSAQDALAASLAERGVVDMAYMEKLYGKTESAIADELGELVFESSPGNWVAREEYLAGNVKQKLAQAKRMAKDMPRFARNVEALEAVQPADIEAVDINVKPGAHWLPREDMVAFVHEIMGNDNGTATYVAPQAKWTIRGNAGPAARSKWATERVDVAAILEAAANQKQIVVRDKLEDDTTRINEAATNAANEKVERIKSEFKRWVWQDDARRERLARLYNDTFNTDRLREYDGSHLSLPGKVSDDIIKLRPHQANAVWRIVQQGNTLLDHVVGAGKTFTMVAGAMELRRMGRARKPMFVVPNHLVGQWAEDFVKLYPGANILAATKKDFEKGNRKRLFARIATGDWDAVIVAHSSFQKVEMDASFQEQFINQQIRDIDEAIQTIRQQEGKNSRSVKQVEKQKDRLKEKLKKLYDADNKDDNLTFGELGVDALFVDEMHEFKNLGFATGMQRVAGLGNPQGSAKAADMFMKVRYINEVTGGNVVAATGTPISNSMAEMYTMQRYLDYATLQDQGLAHFDAWARMYGEVVTDWELSPSGTYKLNSRFAKFVNIPELMQRYLSFGDVINRDDIQRQLAAQGKRLPVPKVKGGKPRNVVVERSDDQADYIGVPTTDANGNEAYPSGSLIYRAEHLPKRPEKGADNMLKIMSDARKAALDMRLIDPSYPDNPGSKIHVAADEIKRIHDQWDADKGTQLVFIDLSTPKGAKAAEASRIRDLLQRAEEGDDSASEALDRMSPDEIAAVDGDFSVYDDLRQKLIDRGIPPAEIAFIHDANTELQKEELFGKVRSGRVRVMLGSTPKMGAGMNVQDRLVALHHMDAPWRPSDLEQREGRIIRQGNRLYERDPDGFEVEIHRYATKQTLDSRMWQTIEGKARFIEQVRKGGTAAREIEDVAGEASNAAEMKAASSGNPLILEEMDLRQKVRKLEQLEEEHNREQFRIRDKVRELKRMKERASGRIKRLQQDAETADKIPAKGFEVTINGEAYTKHKEAGTEILAEAAKMADAGTETETIGDFYGFPVRLDNISGAQFVLTLEGQSEHQITIDDIANTDATGLARRMANVARQIPDEARREHQRLTLITEEIPQLEEQTGDWPQAEELAKLKARHQEVINELKPKQEGQQQGEQEPDATPDVSAMAAPGMDQPMPKWVPTYRQKGVLPRRPEDGQFTLDGKTVKLKPADNPTRREGIRVAVIDIIGPRLYQGKVKGKSRLGFYRASNSEVRVANFDDVEVMAHEMAHYLDMHYTHAKRFTQAYRDKQYRDEVQALSYTSKDKLKGPEGFAEFVRLWLTQYAAASQQAPEFTRKFEEVLAQDKTLDKKLRRLREEMHRWYQQGDMAQFYAMTSGNQYTPAQQATLLLNKRPGELWRQHYIDKIHAAKVMERTLSGDIADATESAYKQLQLLNGIEGIAQESFKHGAPVINDDGNITFEGPSLKDVWSESLRKGPQVLREQELYFVARRARELKRQGRENLISDAQIAEGLALGRKNPHFAQAFRDYQAYRANAMQFYVDSGYITEDAARAMLEKNKEYVPFHRVVESVAGEYTGAGGFQRLKGGTQNIKPVYDNMMLQEQRHLYAALKARALRQLYSQALRHQDGSLFLAKIAPDSKPVKVAVEQMTNKTAAAMAEEGISIAEDGVIEGDGDTVVDKADIQRYFEQNPEELMFWTFGHKPKTTETMVDSFIDGRGKRVWIEIQKENTLLVDMLDNMDYVALPPGAFGTAVKLAMRVKNFQTLTITSMAQFVGPNMARDAQQAFMLSGGKFKPGWDTMKGFLGQLHALISDDAAWHEMKAQGGPAAGRVRTFYHENWGLASDVAYAPRKPFYHPSQMLHTLLDVYMAIADSAEIATRLGFYMRQRKEGISAREAAWQAREISTDFRKHGTYGPWVLLQRTVPFLGAYVQSVDRDIRALADNQGEMKLANLVKTHSGRLELADLKTRVWMAGGLIISLTMLLALLNEDEERYQGLTPDQKARFYHLFIGGRHYTIPKPHGFISLIAQAGEAAIDAMTSQTPKDAADVMKFATAYHFGSDAMPGIINPVAEVALNRTFTGAPVVSQWAQDREARYQYDDRTPLIYVNVGRELNISPVKAHHLMRGYTGYLSDFVDELGDKLLWDTEAWGERPFTRNFGDMAAKQFKPREVPYRTKWTTGYYELRRRAATAQANLSFLRNTEALRDQAPLEDFAEDQVSGALLGINRAFSRIDAAFSDQDEVIASIKYDPALSAEQKEDRIEAYYSQKNDTLKDFYQQVDEALRQVEDEIE